MSVYDEYFTWRMNFAMLCVLFLWGISAYVVCLDLASVPEVGSAAFMKLYPDYSGQIIYEDPTRFWEWNIGNGFVSNIESIAMLGGGFFGSLRFWDLLDLFKRRDKELAWAFFFERIDF